VIGVKFMTKPNGAQWMVRRDAYQKLRDIFDQNGISFAERNVKVEVLADHVLTPDEQKAVTAAAQEAVERTEKQAMATDTP
jgi:small-conductance mechanosensitive channel